MVIVVLVIAGGVWGALSYLGEVTGGLSVLRQHAGWVMILSAVHSTSMVTRHRRRLPDALRQSWIAATPRGALSLRGSIVLGALWVPVWQLALPSVLVVFAGQSDLQNATAVVLSMACGFAGGAALGWRIPIRDRRWNMPGSRYVPRRWGSTPKWSMQASFAGLSRWPVSAGFARLHPDTLRWPMMAAMLSVAAGSSALAGMTVVGVWMLVLYMVTLCSATLRVVDEASLWLRMTPMDARSFAVNMLGRSFVHQILVGLVIASVLAATRLVEVHALVWGASWIVFVVLAYGGAVVHRFGLK